MANISSVAAFGTSAGNREIEGGTFRLALTAGLVW